MRKEHFRLTFRVYGKPRKDGRTLSLYGRVIVNGVPNNSDINTGLTVPVSNWDSKAQTIVKFSKEGELMNEQLERMRVQIREIFNEMIRLGKTPFSQQIRNHYVNDSDSIPYIGRAVAIFHAELLQKVGKEGGMGQLNYNRVVRSTEFFLKFLQINFGTKDVPFSGFNMVEVIKFKDYLFYNLKYSFEYKRKIWGEVRRFFDFANLHQYVERNLLRGVTIPKGKRKVHKYLSEREVNQIIECQYFNERLQHVADCFIFSCYTGMAYNELKNFKPSEHIVFINEKERIHIYRGKTQILCKIPLLKNAKKILEKYDYKLPLITNQKMNEYLKEVGQIAGITQPLNTHLGRKTAGCYLLNNNVRIETVAKILGHSTTQQTLLVYAEIIDKTIDEEVKHLID